MYTADSKAATPWIDACVAALLIDKAELISRILAKDASYRAVSGKLTGVRQRHEDAIAKLDASTVDAYDVNQWWE